MPALALLAALLAAAAATAASGQTAPPAPTEKSADAAEPVEPEPPLPPPEPEPPAELNDLVYRSDTMTYDLGTRAVKLDGHVVIERAGGRLYAARGVVDRVAGTIRLEGGVLAIQALQVAVADAAVIDLRSNAADLIGATVFLKDRTAGPQLLLLADRAAARGTGRNTLVLHGKSVRKLADGGLLASEVSLTPCDCAGRPDYQILSPEIVIRHERAELLRPTLDLFGLPIPVFVPISLPLTDRQTGLLAPRFGYALTTGFGIVEPVFVTLGRSWDATVAAGWYTGTKKPAVPGDAATRPDYAADLAVRTVRGPRLDTELRGAPFEGTTLRLELDAFRDLDQYGSVAGFPTFLPNTDSFGGARGTSGRGLGGFRGVLRAAERTEGRLGTFAVDATVATDSMVISDVLPGERFLDSLRTDLGGHVRTGPAIAGAEATLLQDVRLLPATPDRRAFGDEARRTFERLPSAFVQLPPRPLAGAISLGGEVSIARFQPLRDRDPQEAQTGFGPTDLNAAAAAPATVADPYGLARAPVTRLDAAPKLGLSLVRSAALAVSAVIGGRADAWLFDDDEGRNRRRAYGLFGLRAETELSRRFGPLVHTIVPSVELRVLTPSAVSGGPAIGDPADAGGLVYSSQAAAAQQGLGPGVGLRDGATGATIGVPAARRPYDEIDGAAPERGAGQAVFRVDQAIWTAGPNGRAPTRILELTLAQDALLWAGGTQGRLGEAWALAAAHLGPVSLSVKTNFDWAIGNVSAVQAAVQLADQRGDSLRASAQVFRATAPEQFRAGIDELFSTARLASAPGDLVGGGSVGATARLPIDRFPLSVSYAMDRHLGVLLPGTPDLIHHAAASVDTPCRCAGVQAALDLPFANGKLISPTVRFVLDLKQLGAFGTP